MQKLSPTQLITTLILLFPLYSQCFFQPQIPSKNQNKLTVQTGDSNDNRNNVIPYVIQRLEANQAKDFEELCKMTIQVFFNEEDDDSQQSEVTTPWKSVQLAYLRHLQYSDLRTRKYMTGPQNDMFIAREVKVTKKQTELQPELMLPDLSQIMNSNVLPPLEGDDEMYSLDNEVIGFCEISARVFSLPEFCYENNVPTKAYRPVLTNLAVKKSARRSGVGTALVNTCENAVMNLWNPSYDDIVLQVEEDNPKGFNFYKKLGYNFVYSDPSTRRFDTSGWFLEEVRSTKNCLRKELRKIDNKDENDDFLASFVSGFRALREKIIS